MIGRRCKGGDVLSRPVLIARDLSCKPRLLEPRVLSQVKYCGGYSGGDPPLPIPNREVKPARADGTAPPGGRVGRRRPSGSPSEKQETADPAGSLLFIQFRLKYLVEKLINLVELKDLLVIFVTVENPRQ